MKIKMTPYEKFPKIPIWMKSPINLFNAMLSICDKRINKTGREERHFNQVVTIKIQKF